MKQTFSFADWIHPLHHALPVSPLSLSTKKHKHAQSHAVTPYLHNVSTRTVTCFHHKLSTTSASTYAQATYQAAQYMKCTNWLGLLTTPTAEPDLHLSNIVLELCISSV